MFGLYSKPIAYCYTLLLLGTLRRAEIQDTLVAIHE